jgi:hypothetical protein
MMHIHVPKALHSWVEVAKEIGVITIGVLIALALEQMLEDREWHRKVAAAETGMRRELFWDNGPQVYQRAATHPCAIAQLDRIRSAVEQGKSRAEIGRLIDGYWVQFVTYDSLAHEAANDSEVAAHMPENDRNAFDEAYAAIPLMDKTSAQEAADLARLRALKRSGGPLEQYEEAEVLAGVEALRNDDRMMWVSAKSAFDAMHRLQGRLDPKRMKLFMDNARDHYGTCVRDLRPNWPDALPRDY